MPTVEDWSSKDAYMASTLYGEGEATANNIVIHNEAQANGYYVPIAGTHVDEYIQEFNDGINAHDMTVAYREIGQSFGAHEVTGDGVPYSQYYGNFYDKYHP